MLLPFLLILAQPPATQEPKPPEQPQPPAAAAPEPGAVAVQDLTLNDDPNQRYFLITPTERAVPDGGYKLLIILPGGSGAADFHPFCRRIAENAMPPGYIVAQAVAPKTTDPERLIWPIAKNPDPAVKVPTESFVDNIIADVKSRYPLNPRHIFILGWSSGGPPAYAATLRKDSPITGAFVAMSVYHPQTIPDIDAAKGKAFYFYHSPTDFIRIRFPETARDELAAKGASTHLETYEGGHSWRGDVFGNIRRGIEWLESQTKSAPEQPPGNP